MTYGYIYEGDLERFLAGTTVVPGPSGPLPPSFPCPFCTSAYASPGERNDHLRACHSAERPVLLLGGVEPASHDVIRRGHSTQEISVLNCTSILVHRPGLGADELQVDNAVRLLGNWDGRLRLQLINKFDKVAEPVLQSYDLRFEVYGTPDLDQADLEFVKLLGRPDPSMGDVDSFTETEAAKKVPLYASALADYVIGVLQKDRPGGAPGISANYRSKLNGSLRELQEYDRPLANLISGFVRLSSNDVARRIPPTRSDLLNATLAVLESLAHDQTPSFEFEPHEPKIGNVVCPIDNGTSRVLDRAASLSRLRRFSDDIVEQFRAELDLPSIDALDKAKLAALWAARAISLGMKIEAEFPLRELVGDAMFGHWAENNLEKLDD